MYELNQTVPLTVHLSERKLDLDEAFNRATEEANIKFGADYSGHLKNVNGWKRSCCSVRLDFVGVHKTYGMGGPTYSYTFCAKAEVNEESPAPVSTKLTCNQTILLLDVHRGFLKSRHLGTVDNDLKVLAKRGLIEIPGLIESGINTPIGFGFDVTDTGKTMVENILNQTAS